MCLPIPASEPLRTQFDRTVLSLNQFISSPAGESSLPAEEALAFLKELPGHFPAPKAVESEDGVVTLFWDSSELYADIEFLGDGHFSVFTRSRRGGIHDQALDSVPLEKAAGDWLYTYLGNLLPLSPRRAA
jgi:hypothetical protein